MLFMASDFLCLFVLLPSCAQQFVRLSIHPPTLCSLTHPFTPLLTHPSTYQHSPIHPSTHSPIHPSAHLPIYHPPLCLYPSTQSLCLLWVWWMQKALIRGQGILWDVPEDMDIKLVIVWNIVENRLDSVFLQSSVDILTSFKI